MLSPGRHRPVARNWVGISLPSRSRRTCSTLCNSPLGSGTAKVTGSPRRAAPCRSTTLSSTTLSSTVAAARALAEVATTTTVSGHRTDAQVKVNFLLMVRFSDSACHSWRPVPTIASGFHRPRPSPPAPLPYTGEGSVSSDEPVLRAAWETGSNCWTAGSPPKIVGVSDSRQAVSSNRATRGGARAVVTVQTSRYTALATLVPSRRYLEAKPCSAGLSCWRFL